MKSKVAILLLLTLSGSLPCRGPARQERIITEAGFITRYSLDSSSRIQSVVLGFRAIRPVYYKIEHQNRILAGGKFMTGLNIVSIAPAELNLQQSGEKKLLLILKSPERIPDHRLMVIVVQGLGTNEGSPGEERSTVYSLRMFYQDELLLAFTDRIQENIQDSKRAKEHLRHSPAYSDVPRISTPEEEGLYYSRYAVSFLDLAALGIRQVLRGIQQAREKDTARQPVPVSRLIGRIPAEPGSTFSSRKVQLDLMLPNGD
jgi:hypothetical protein